MSPHSRRLVRVPVAFALLDSMVRTDFCVNRGVRCLRGVPPDATLVGSYTDPDRQIAYLVYTHESFLDVPEGEFVPELYVEHRTFIDEKED